MTSDTRRIAARLAAASQLFPLPHSLVGGKAVRDSTVVVEVDGAAIAATMTVVNASTAPWSSW